MSETQKHTKPNVPNLRFPGFSGEWKNCTLGQLGDIKGGGTPDTLTNKYWNGGIQWFTPSEIGKTKYVRKSERTISSDGLSNSSAKLLPPKSILLSSRATVGECSINLEECCTNQGFQSFVPNTLVESEFLYYRLLTHKKELIRKACGSTFLEISAKQIGSIPSSIPERKEQEKIVSFLSLIDEHISIQSKVIEKYESLIKALAYETIGKYTPNTLLSECVRCSSSTLKESDLAEEGAVPAYGAAGISGFTDSALSDEDSILITKDGSGFGSLRYVNGPHSFVGTLNSMTPKEGVYLPYIYYALQNVCFESYRTGQAIPHIYFKDYGKETIYCPSLDNQKRLAKGLEMIDTKIGIDRAVLQSLQSAKAYLLSAMFI